MSLEKVAEEAANARALREVADAAQFDYIKAVEDALRAGCTVPEIARAAGVTRTAVYAALRKHGWREGQDPSGRRTPQPRDQSLLEYRLARHAQELAQEERTKGYAADVAFERAQGVAQPITYKPWLGGGREWVAAR